MLALILLLIGVKPDLCPRGFAFFGDGRIPLSESKKSKALKTIPVEEFFTPTRTVRRFKAGNEIVPVLDAWSKRQRFSLINAGKDRRVYRRRRNFGLREWAEIKHDGKRFTLSVWIEPPYLGRLLSFFLVPARRHCEIDGWIGKRFASAAATSVNELLLEAGLSPIEVPAEEPASIKLDWSIGLLAALVTIAALVCYASLTARAGFRPGLYVSTRALKLSLLSSMLIPALTALGIHYWVSVRGARRTAIRGLSVILALAYFLGSFSYGLQRSGLISLILLNESGYYCVEKLDAEACNQTKTALSDRPLREKTMIVRYADSLINSYKARTASPTP